MAIGIGEALDSAWEFLAMFLQFETVSNPQLYKAVLLLVVGFVGGRILSDVVHRLLRMTSIDELGVKSDVQLVLRKFSYRGSLSQFIADLLKWAVYTLTLLALFNLFGSELLTYYAEQVMGIASRLILVMFVLIFGALISERIGSIVIQMLRVGKISGRVDESHAEIPLYIVAGHGVKYVGFIVTAIIGLAMWGVDAVILYVLIGALAFGAVLTFVISSRYLLRNIAISMYFQASRMFRGGETVRVGEYEGEIDSIRPLYTKIKSGEDTYYIPNTELVSQVIRYKGE